MPKKPYLGFLLLLVNVQLAAITDRYPHSTPKEFAVGEQLTYNIQLGWFKAGVATMQVANSLYEINGRPCYKIDVHIQSKGLIHLLKLKIKNHWGTYVDTSAFIPHRFYRYIQEGKYRKNEIVHFDHEKGLAIVERLDDYTKEPLTTAQFVVPTSIQDLVSGYYYLRTLDFDYLQVGDIISLVGFFDEKLHKDFQVKFLGRQPLKTKLGTFNTLVLAPVSTSSSLFASNDRVEFFFSDDANRIPLKIKAKLLIGSITMDLQSIKDLPIVQSTLIHR